MCLHGPLRSEHSGKHDIRTLLTRNGSRLVTWVLTERVTTTPLTRISDHGSPNKITGVSSARAVHGSWDVQGVTARCNITEMSSSDLAHSLHGPFCNQNLTELWDMIFALLSQLSLDCARETLQKSSIFGLGTNIRATVDFSPVGFS